MYYEASYYSDFSHRERWREDREGSRAAERNEEEREKQREGRERE